MSKSVHWNELCGRVWKLDGGRCLYPGCRKEPGPPHHIIYRSQQGKDVVENLISLCPEHHNAVHNGMDQFGRRYSGRQLMMSILGSLKNQRGLKFRWSEALAELKRKAK